MKDKMIYLKDSNGEEKAYQVISVFHNKEKIYVAYFDDSNPNEKKDILVSEYIKSSAGPRFEEIKTEEEWKFIDEYLGKEVFGELDEI